MPRGRRTTNFSAFLALVGESSLLMACPVAVVARAVRGVRIWAPWVWRGWQGRSLCSRCEPRLLNADPLCRLPSIVPVLLFPVASAAAVANAWPRSSPASRALTRHPIRVWEPFELPGPKLTLSLPIRAWWQCASSAGSTMACYKTRLGEGRVTQGHAWGPLIALVEGGAVCCRDHPVNLAVIR